MKYFTVGPVEMYPSTLELGNHQVPYFRNSYFSCLIKDIDKSLKNILDMAEEDRNIILTASGTGAMEAVIMNCLTPLDKALVISGGSFGQRFEQLCRIHKIPHDVLEIPYGDAFQEDDLVPFCGQGYTALLVNIHETSTGQLYPITILSKYCMENRCYFIVDGISSLLSDEIFLHQHHIDALIFSSQKALALPPGISVVSLSKRMCEKINSQASSLYFDFTLYLKDGLRGQTPFTPAVGIIIQMQEMLNRILVNGIHHKIGVTRSLAEDFRKKLINSGFCIPSYPLSNAMTPILLKEGAEYYYQRLIYEYGITVNPSGGHWSDSMLRIGHMGNLTPDDNTSLIQALCEIRGNFNHEKRN